MACDVATLVTNATSNGYTKLPERQAMAIETYLLCSMASGGFSGGQIIYYTANPNTEGLTPTNQALPAIAATKDGTGAIYTWNTTTLVWN